MEQARQLLRALRGSPDELALRVALLCGLRLSELLALRWGDVDLDRGCLVVRQALDLPAGDGSPRFKETKTHRAERPVSMPEQLVVDLREHRRRQVEWRLAATAWVELDLVFTGEGCLPLVPVTLRKRLYRVLAQADLPKVRLHGLRQAWPAPSWRW